MQDAEARDRVATLEGLLEQLEHLPDPAARERALEAVQTLVELYGSGLERIVDVLSGRGDAREIGDALAADELVSHLLLLHDLHPVPLEERVRGALDEVRPYLESHGGDVELLAVEDGVVRLRMEGSCSGCPSSTVTLKLAIEDAIRKAAPDVEDIEADGVDAEPSAPQLLQIEVSDALRAKSNATPSREPGWVAIEDAELVGTGSTAMHEIGGEPVLLIRLTKGLYAYRPTCAACGANLDDAEVAGARLQCQNCGATFDVRRAGRSTDGSDVQLQPIPLLHDASGGVRVAMGVPA